MKSQRRKNQLPILPGDIIHDILSLLPPKPLARFRCVCKSWYNLLTDSIFLRMQCNYRHCRVIISSVSRLKSIDIEGQHLLMANHKSPSKRPIGFLGSCDGLLCVRDDEYLFLWNPTTRQYKQLPGCSAYSIDHSHSNCILYGLGYDKSIDDYKVVKGEFSQRQDCKVEVYTRKTDSWKRIEDFPYKFPSFYTGIFVDGFLHWLANQGNDHLIIASLDLAKEKFGEVALPNCRHVQNYAHRMGVLKGMLCLYCQEIIDSCMWTIWVMKEYGVTESWTILMKIPFDLKNIPFRMPLCLTKNGEFVMQVGSKKWFKYNPREKKFKKILDLETLVAVSATYVESLVSPNIDKWKRRKIQANGL